MQTDIELLYLFVIKSCENSFVETDYRRNNWIEFIMHLKVARFSSFWKWTFAEFVKTGTLGARFFGKQIFPFFVNSYSAHKKTWQRNVSEFSAYLISQVKVRYGIWWENKLLSWPNFWSERQNPMYFIGNQYSIKKWRYNPPMNYQVFVKKSATWKLRAKYQLPSIHPYT